MQNRITGYDQWAVRARAWCTQKEADRVYDQVPVLNEATTAAFNTVLDKLLHAEEQVADLRAELVGVQTQLAQVLALLTERREQNALPAAIQNNDNDSEHNAGEEGKMILFG